MLTIFLAAWISVHPPKSFQAANLNAYQAQFGSINPRIQLSIIPPGRTWRASVYNTESVDIQSRRPPFDSGPGHRSCCTEFFLPRFFSTHPSTAPQKPGVSQVWVI
jgi:hypothetical protein